MIEIIPFILHVADGFYVMNQINSSKKLFNLFKHIQYIQRFVNLEMQF